MESRRYRTYADIDFSQIKKNAQELKALITDNCRFMSVIKGNAYGHGIEETVEVIDEVTDWYAVATFEEAMRIRNSNSKKPILIFGYVEEYDLSEVSKNKITLTGLSIEYISTINNYCADNDLFIDMHIEIDTGFNRTGITCRSNTIDQTVKTLLPIYQFGNIRFTGIFTHFPCAGSKIESEIKFTDLQFDSFTELVTRLQNEGIKVGLCHVCNSKATLYNSEKHLDLVRVGAYIFGLASPEDRRLANIDTPMKWKAKIIHIKTIPKGEGVSYNHLFVASKETKVGVVSVGFADGFRRSISLSKDAYVLCKGQKVKILGRICMDMMMVDLSEVEEVKVGDYITLVGWEEQECSDPYLLGKIINGTAGEIPVGMTSRVSRLLRNNDL